MGPVRSTERRSKRNTRKKRQISQPFVPYTEADFPNPHATNRRVGKSSEYQVLARSDVLAEGTRKIKQNRGDAFLSRPRRRGSLSTAGFVNEWLTQIQVRRQGNQAALRSTPAWNSKCALPSRRSKHRLKRPHWGSPYGARPSRGRFTGKRGTSIAQWKKRERKKERKKKVIRSA